MRVVLQRAARAEVRVAGRRVAAIGAGCVALVGVAVDDGAADIAYLARKIVGLRIWPDAEGKLNLGLCEPGPRPVLAISQFTLLADTRRGRRPSWERAAPGPVAEPLFLGLVAALRAAGIEVHCGVFGAHMEVELVNDGPVTLVLDSRER